MQISGKKHVAPGVDPRHFERIGRALDRGAQRAHRDQWVVLARYKERRDRKPVQLIGYLDTSIVVVRGAKSKSRHHGELIALPRELRAANRLYGSRHRTPG